MLWVFFFIGLTLLILGAEALVRGAARLAAITGLSPLVIGLTVVAYGTSSPELAVSLQSGLGGQTDVALGNIVGSNIFNVLFILGASALITPLVVSQQLIRLDVPIMIGVSVLLPLFALDGQIGRLEGGLLLTGIVVYTIFLIYQSRRESRTVKEEYAREYGFRDDKPAQVWLINLGLVTGGLALLVLGSRLFVEGAIALAQIIGVSELIIGLTIVAAGTSLPEVATSLVASLRGERDIAVGNVVGSNIFNILGVLGLSSLVAPNGIGVSTAALRFDIPVMIGVAVACLPFFFTGQMISRWEGIVFLGYYAAYLLYLILNSTHHKGLPLFSAVMMGFVIPITLLTIIVLTWRAIRGPSRTKRGFSNR